MNDMTVKVEKPKKITAEDMEKYLADRYCDSREWVFLTQVHNSTGSAGRIADAMAFNMYHSTGYEVLGFEIKVSRSDWLCEMKDMSKSNEIMEYCDKWYLVVSDASIVQDGELPKNWGLFVLKNGKLVQKVRSIPQKTKHMPMHFIASILRRGAKEVDRIRSRYISRESITDELEKARKKGYEEARGYNGKRVEEDLKELREKVKAFEEASGVPLENWRGKEYIKTLGMYVKTALKLTEGSIDYDIQRLEQTVNTLSEGVVQMKKIKSELGKQPSV